ncbi:MAG: hypothetical protein ABIL58_26540 [Pseudomonadota bacterium]
MQTLRTLCRDMLSDPAFEDCYRRECHVCPCTVRIAEALDVDTGALQKAAAAVNATPEAVHALVDADHCDPDLTIRLCRHLNLPVPENCPRAS